MDKLNKQVDKSFKDVYAIRDATIMDLRAIMATIPFVGENFYVQKISGLTQLKKESGPYYLTITGVGLGIPSEKIRSKIVLKVGGNPIDIKTHRSDAQSTKIEIPNNVFHPHFYDKQMANLKASIEVVHEVYKGWLLFKGWKGKTYHIPVNLALMPKFAGTIKSTSTVPVFGWVSDGSATDTRTTGNHHCSRNCKGEPTRTGYTITIKVAGGNTPRKVGDKKLSSPNLRCINGPCGGWRKINGTWLSESDTRATGSFDVWSKPTTWRLTAKRHVWKLVKVVLLQFSWRKPDKFSV